MTDQPVIISVMARLAPQRRAELVAERRDQILDAALRAWTREGFDATTVETVAREAGVAKGTVYLYFATKEDLLDAAAERWSLLPDLAGLGASAGDLPLEEAMPRVAEQLWARLRAAAPLVAVVVRELALRPAQARRFLERVVLPANAAFAAFLEQRIRAGELRPLDAFVAARAFVGMLVIFLWTQEVLGGRELRPIDDRAITGTASALFLRGVLADPGTAGSPASARAAGRARSRRPGRASQPGSARRRGR
ncbi:MAG TPA: TetR/AcrR family transcriptional regulator [Myxococcota bacterium]|jgi:AcrR family transcriptional regulator|nr:TetR/AcrR family transcriptional regulator [Myxococcota bacterium]